MNALPDVEWGSGRIFYQIGWACDPEQGESEALKLRAGRARVVAGTNSRKEVVAEIQPQGRIDLINENDQPCRAYLTKHKRLQKFTEALYLCEFLV